MLLLLVYDKGKDFLMMYDKDFLIILAIFLVHDVQKCNIA